MALSPLEFGRKFKRNFSLFVQHHSATSVGSGGLAGASAGALASAISNPQNYLNVKPPFTVEIDVDRNSYTSANTAVIRVYNLSSRNRALIAHDEYDFNNYQQVILQAGYGDGPQFPTIFRGNARKVESVRDGVDIVTTIEALDGGFAQDNAVFNFNFPSGTDRQSVILSMINSLTSFNIKAGSIGNYSTGTTTPRGNSYSGDTFALLEELTGNGIFVDSETINALLDNEYIYSPHVPLINSASGLLGTPVRQSDFLTFSVMFEPLIRVGALIQIQNITGFNYSGYFRVASVKHRGRISETSCGELITSIGVPYTPGYRAVTPVQAQSL